MWEKDRRQRLALADAAARHARGGMSRRRFLHLCAMAGIGFSSPRFLTGCDRDSKADSPSPIRAEDMLGPSSASVAGTEQQKFLKDVGRSFRGVTLRIATEATPPSKAIKRLAQEEFTPLTGIEVEWDLLLLENVLAKISQETALRTGSHDVFYWDQAWIGRFVDDAVPPLELLEIADLAYPGYDFDDLMQPLLEHVSSYKGRLAAIPYDIPIFITMYRRDIFENLGLAPPETMADYLEAARAINQELAPNVYGTTAQWKSGHYALECNMTAWLWGHGGSIFNADQEPAVDDERGQAALEYMLELGRYMPPGVTAWDWFGEAASFAQGRAGFYTSWGEFFPGFDDPEQSAIVGLAEPSPCPKEIFVRPASACGFDEVPGISHQGGSSLAISRYSRQVEAAWIFLQWATSPDITARASLLGGGASPIRESTYSDPRVLAMDKVAPGTTRHFGVTRNAILNHMGTEPHLPGWSDLAVNGFAVELGRLTTGQQDIRTTLANMASAARMAVRQEA
jgi:multiple sugar transport system substrate-binding protein